MTNALWMNSIPRVSSGLSIIGSIYIVIATLHDQSNSTGTGSNATYRALVGMSLIDIMSSIAWFASSWMSTHRSICAAQGFLLQMAIGAPLYSGSLILYYFLMIRYRWTKNQVNRIEKWVHGFIWVYSLGTSIQMLWMDMYHYIGPVCWISDPPECFSDTGSDLPAVCGQAKKWSTALFCVPLWISIALTIWGLVDITLQVRKTSNRMNRYNFRASQESAESKETTKTTAIHDLRRSGQDVQKATMRTLFFAMAFVVTWTPSTIWSVAQWFDYYPFWISFLWTLFEPLQGLWNLLIFVHNRPQTIEAMRKLICCTSCTQVKNELNICRRTSEMQSSDGRSVETGSSE